MESALHRPVLNRSLVIPLAAAVLGAGVATTAFALVDDGHSRQTKVVFKPTSASHPEGRGPAHVGPEALASTTEVSICRSGIVQ